MSDLTLDLAADAVLLQLFFLPVPVLLAARGQQLLLDLDTAVHVPVLQLRSFAKNRKIKLCDWLRKF